MDHALLLHYLLENGVSGLAYTEEVLSTAILHDHCKSMKLSGYFKNEYCALYTQFSHDINHGNVKLSPSLDHHEINDIFVHSDDYIALSRFFKRSSRFNIPIPQREFFKALLRPSLFYLYVTRIRTILHRLNSF